MAPALAERIRDFRFDRLAKIRAGETPLGGSAEPVLVLHVVPYDAFSGRRRLSVSQLHGVEKSFPLLGPPILCNSANRTARPNLDGLCILDTSSSGAVAYVQLWRAGPIEAACQIRLPTTRDNDTLSYIDIRRLERACVTAIENYSKGLQTLEIAPLCAIFMTLLGVRHQSYETNEFIRGMTPSHMTIDSFGQGGQFRDETVPTSDVGVERWPDDRQAVAALLRPAFDEIANAAGLLASPTFDAAGRWVVDDP